VAPDLSIVVVSYNVAAYLDRCLASLPAACGSLSYDVVVVDNDSPDDSARLVATRYPEIRLLANRDNVGFARAVNQALPLTRGRYVLLFNPDAVAPPASLRRLLEIADRHPDAGLVSPLLRDPDTGTVEAPLRPFLSWRSSFARYTPAKALLRLAPRPRWAPVVDRPTTTGWLIGACLLIRREALAVLGGLDEAYFLWFEDIDYSARAIRAGWPVLCTSEVTVDHYGGKSVEQERSGTMQVRLYQGLLHHLGRRSWRDALLKPLFVVLLLLGAVGRLPVLALKTVGYHGLGDGERSARYRLRLGNSLDFLRLVAARRFRL
jgi:GT2 family glycosyltransferase